VNFFFIVGNFSVTVADGERHDKGDPQNASDTHTHTPMRRFKCGSAMTL
jgi:hypothetical protein